MIGLTDEEVVKSRNKYGSNEIKKTNNNSFYLHSTILTNIIH